MAYPQERKEAILKKLLPPVNQSVAEVAREEGISVQTIYSWRTKARQSGIPMPHPTTIGLDISKNSFHLVSLDKRCGKIRQKKHLKHTQVLAWFANHKVCQVSMEA